MSHTRSPIVLSSFALLLVVGAGSDASAGPTTTQNGQAPAPTVQAAPKTPLKTVIKGDITVPSTFSSSGQGNGPVSLGQGGFGCSNIVITANSKEKQPKPPGTTGFYVEQPVWSRTVNATGTYSSGKCSYSLSVPGDKEFGLYAGTSGDFPLCQAITVAISNSTPTWQTVPRFTTKVDNLTAAYIDCWY
jgi:hypothetical protein